MNRGKAFEMNTYEWNKSLKVFGWSLGSALVALALAFLANVEVKSEYAALVPVVNTILYAVAQYIRDNSETAQ